MIGRRGNDVYSVRGGEQLVRAYQPNVYNPNTQLQVAARARMKLMSQLSAVMAPVIAIPKQGPVSSRNLFVQLNYAASSYTDNQANVTLSAIKLTKSVVALPAISTTVRESDMTVALSSSAVQIDRMVYCLFIKQDDNTLRYITSRIVSEAGEQGTYAASFPVVTSNGVIYAYGVRDNTEAARVVFGDMVTPQAEDVAKVIVQRTLTDADITLTETRSVLITQ